MLPIFREIVDSLNITSQRATQVFALYESLRRDTNSTYRASQLDAARKAIVAALEIVQLREESYRVPASRIASWQYGPTSYHFGYVWTAHSAYYFYRSVNHY